MYNTVHVCIRFLPNKADNVKLSRTIKFFQNIISKAKRQNNINHLTEPTNKQCKLQVYNVIETFTLKHVFAWLTF